MFSERSERSTIKPIPETADVAEMPWFAGVRLQLPAQTANVVVDDAVRHEGVRPPRLADQLIASQDAAGRTDEHLQQLEFQRGQLADLIAAAHLATIEIDVDVTDPDSPRRRTASAAAQQCRDPRAQLADTERFRHVIVGAGFETEHLFRFL